MNYSEYNHLPWEQRLNCLRNTIMALRQFDTVDIHYEKDILLINRTGVNHASFSVEISTPEKIIKAESENLEEAIITAVHDANQKVDEETALREKQRAAALNKLTPEERKLLHLK